MDKYKSLNKVQIRSILDKAYKKMQELDKNIVITTGIIFTSQTDFFYIFNIFKDNKAVEKISVNDVETWNKTFKDLTTKYKVNIIYDYSDLTFNQILYLRENLTDLIESTELESVYMDSILEF